MTSEDTIDSSSESSDVLKDASSVITSTASSVNKINRHSDTEIFKDGPIVRKYHSKSFSLSENRMITGGTVSGDVDDGAGGNLFQQNRELWEKRVGSNYSSLTTPRILTRNRLAPDLVMDLPLANLNDGQQSETNSGNGSNSSDSDNETNGVEETTAEIFSGQNQSTLKKNERYSSNSGRSVIGGSGVGGGGGGTSTDIMCEVLHIQEDFNEIRESKSMKDLHKSPIPLRNTQKYVSQFADLHLTGGCLTHLEKNNQTNTTTTTNVITSQTGGGGGGLSSFKPQVRAKPQILKKPLVVASSQQSTTVTTPSPEMMRKSNPE